MKPPSRPVARWGRILGQAAGFLGLAAGVTVLMLWLAGKFSPKVPEVPPAEAIRTERALGPAVPVRLLTAPREESAVGTIRAVHETSVGSKMLARVLEVQLKAGQKVQAGDVLVRLDDTDVRAKLQQVKAGLASADAHRGQAVSDEQRASRLVQSNAISQQEYERAATALRSAEAEVRRAQEAVKEVEASLEWAIVRAPMNAVVIDKKVDVGDMVSPGQPLATLFDPKRMQLVATVRESLAHRLQVGQEIAVRVDGLNKQCGGTVSEIVPEAQAASRSFQVKVTGPCPAGVYTGMFGRLLIPLGDEQVLVVPRRAVRLVGQLELVDVAENGRTTRRAVRTGRSFGDDVEVLSGLREGEQVTVPPAAAAQEASHE